MSEGNIGELIMFFESELESALNKSFVSEVKKDSYIRERIIKFKELLEK